MRNEYILKCYYNEKMEECKMKILEKEGKVILHFFMEKLDVIKEGNNYFNALLKIRKELEARGVKLLCKGCCYNVYPSPMFLDLCGGLIAYTMKMGKEIDRRESVNIFDECLLEEYATIEKQLEYCKGWYENIKLVRKNKF